MRLEHFRAFCWLRWRLFLHQMQRGGAVNTVLHVILAIVSVILILGAFACAFVVGFMMPDRWSPAILMYIWDGAVVLFIFTWMVGVLAELQRSEALSIDKFLHLPVTISGVFLLNYLSSLMSMNLFIFVPMQVGLVLGLTLSRGPIYLLGLPLVAGFFLMITTLTYQFQGWLASLMTNKRRRRTIIVVVTLVFVLVFQLPNLINIIRPWEYEQQRDEAWKTELAGKKAEWAQARDAGVITAEEYDRRVRQIQVQHQADRKQQNEQLLQQFEQGATIANIALPPGWLPLGMRGLANGDVLPALAGVVGLSLIGVVSLWRAYRTTLRIYTGVYTAAAPKAVPASAEKAASPGGLRRSARLLERSIPGLSEQTAAIALAGLQSLMRAPEAKMLLLMPIMLVVIFGGMHLNSATGSASMPDAARPFLAFGAVSMVLLSLVQFVGNQFGFDRSGFRIYVLSPAPRRDILLGKNLAVAPIALTLCIVAASVVQGLYPMRVDRFLALLPQILSMYVVFCMLGNCLSIYSPMHIAAGAMKAGSMNLVTFLSNMLFIGMLWPAFAITLIPMGIDVGLDALGLVLGWPIALPLSLLECAGIIALYRAVLRWEGDLLQGREQRILETVTTKAE